MLYDKDIRVKLYTELRAFAPKKSVIINEFGVWNNRIDVAVVDDCLNGYEIKSDKDSLSLLSGQEALYSKVFDNVTIICTNKHAIEIWMMIPSWWGIVEASFDAKHGVIFQTFRTPTQNPNVDKRYLAGILWKSERLTILDKYGLSKGMEYKKRELLLDKLCEHLTLSQIHCAVIDIIKHREWDDKRGGIEVLE